MARRIASDFLYDDKDGLNLQILPTEEGGEDSCRAWMLRRALKRALADQITEKQRRYFLLHIGEGLSMTEIAERYGVAPSTVSRTIARAKARLENCLRYYR